MREIIGQEQVRERLATLTPFPRFLILEAPKGAGKRTLANWIAQGMEAEIVESQKVDDIRAVIEASMTLSEQKLFIFPDAQGMNMQAQNALLKSLEEPAKNAYYIMTVNSLQNVLSTIKSRAQAVTLEGYTREQLRAFTDSEVLLDICTTPGQILRYQEIDHEALIDHCQKVIDNIGRLNMANVFNILSHVQETNYDLLIPTMQYCVSRNLKDNASPQECIKLLRVIQETSGLLTYSATINTKNALETMLLKLWEVYG